MLGIYKLNKRTRFRVGISSFELPEGSEVKVTAIDMSRDKMLVEFDKNTVDWFDASFLKDNDFTKIHCD